jgi:hypothetical protein
MVADRLFVLIESRREHPSRSAEHEVARLCQPCIVTIGGEGLDVVGREVHETDLCEVCSDTCLAVGDQRRLSVRSDATISVANPGIGNHYRSAASDIYTEQPSSFLCGEEYLVAGDPGAGDSDCHIADRCRSGAGERVCLQLVVRQETKRAAVGRKERMERALGTRKWPNLEAVERSREQPNVAFR